MYNFVPHMLMTLFVKHLIYNMYNNKRYASVLSCAASRIFLSYARTVGRVVTENPTGAYMGDGVV